MIVRRLIYSLGFRYRLHVRSLPGKPDLVFAGRRKVIFVHGCFWHQHSKKSCHIVRVPKSSLAYWKSKLERNINRDSKHLAELRADGWKVFVVWECSVNDIPKLSKQLTAFLKDGTKSKKSTRKKAATKNNGGSL